VGTGLGRGGLPLEALRDDIRPVALILGNEEQGLPRSTLEGCDAIVTLRGAGRVQSLNVSATAAILAYALRPRPRPISSKPPERPAPPSGRREPGPRPGGKRP
jgi:TrmH RNA methyltransferase